MHLCLKHRKSDLLFELHGLPTKNFTPLARVLFSVTFLVHEMALDGFRSEEEHVGVAHITFHINLISSTQDTFRLSRMAGQFVRMEATYLKRPLKRDP